MKITVSRVLVAAVLVVRAMLPGYLAAEETKTPALVQEEDVQVMELVRWRSGKGVSDNEMIAAVAGILPDLKALPGFQNQTLYKDAKGTWVDVYVWTTEADAVASNDLMADKPSFKHLMTLIEPDSVTIEFLYWPDTE